MLRSGVLCQDLHATTFDDDRFDLVISEDVLDHVTDYQRALRELRRSEPATWPCARSPGRSLLPETTSPVASSSRACSPSTSS
jgi:hypothetical protein